MYKGKRRGGTWRRENRRTHGGRTRRGEGKGEGGENGMKREGKVRDREAVAKSQMVVV